MPFAKFGLSPSIVEAVKAMGYVDPTPIQQQAIPVILSGKDLIGGAQTGTGKTAAFALPILSKLGQHQSRTRVLILEPTRELADQVGRAIQSFAQFTDLTYAVLYGGVGYGAQLQALKTGVDILVATPGRLLDHLQKGAAKLTDVQHLVLDEADRMLDMGFLPDVKRIVERCPRQRQTMMFSATVPPQLETLTRWCMNQPVKIEIGHNRSPAETVKHVLYPVAERQKKDLLRALLDKVHYQSVIVFCRTKHRADAVVQLLKRNNHAAAVIHSSRTQKDRERALQGFREGKYEVLVATDIAARGLDIADVSHVINFDVPLHPEDYIHRIGRTGRAEAKGDAFTLMVAEDSNEVAKIERFIGRRIERTKLEEFNYEYTAIFDDDKKAAPGVHRKIKGVRLSGGYYFGPAKRKR